jgi:hypothetical protein
MADSATYFDGDKANAWVQRVQALNEKAQALLTEVNQTISELGQQSAGSIGDALIQSATSVAEKFTKLVQTLAKAIDAFVGFIEKYGKVIVQAVEGIASVIKVLAPLLA